MTSEEPRLSWSVPCSHPMRLDQARECITSGTELLLSDTLDIDHPAFVDCKAPEPVEPESLVGKEAAEVDAQLLVHQIRPLLEDDDKDDDDGFGEKDAGGVDSASDSGDEQGGTTPDSSTSELSDCFDGFADRLRRGSWSLMIMTVCYHCSPVRRICL